MYLTLINSSVSHTPNAHLEVNVQNCCLKSHHFLLKTISKGFKLIFKMLLCFAVHKLGEQLYANIHSPFFLKRDFLKTDYMFDIKIYPCFVYSLLTLHPDTITAPKL